MRNGAVWGVVGVVVALSGCGANADGGDAGAGIDAGSWGFGEDAGDRFSNCVLGGDECAEGERCAYGQLDTYMWTGFRCTSEPGTLSEGEACAFDVPVTFADGLSYRTSRCGEDLVCQPPAFAESAVCVRPCHLLGCASGEICPGYWQSCVTAIECDPLTQSPCGASERCAHVRPIGGGGDRWVCRDTGDGAIGAVCASDGDCARELGCAYGRCATRCDARPLPDAGVPSPLPDGGTVFHPAPSHCEDGSLCVDVAPDDGAQVGVCDADLVSDCSLADPSSCESGERCAWGQIDEGRRHAMRCVSEPGTLGAGAACTIDVAVSLEGGQTLMTSRCGEGLACAPYSREAGTCIAPCDAFGCEAGELCPHAGGECIPDVRCDPSAPSPCAGGGQCRPLTPYGASTSIMVCIPPGGDGDRCGSHVDCGAGLGCHQDYCAPLCDPTWYPVPPGSDGAIPLPDGGANRQPRCADGSFCVPHFGSMTPAGVCDRD
ncbi:hypothetical protein [Sandaracinus amylolyticus]|uniref:hypothetical protein n=1 Tax=Sandaracinus amylolyticus TaxID=927083 RepID=UPI001F25B8D4|nr:hypothetical protein [Sandaracinus amylolyticus]UJR85247.1 Hypothetical protein I5071_73270 [Sandaracinus amylolyticus]